MNDGVNDGYAVSSDGARIFYRYYKGKGKSPCLTFLHGGSGSGSAFFQQKKFLAKMFSLLIVDLRGHGNSSRGRGEGFFRLEKFSDDVASVMDQVGVSKAFVIGHCFGSLVAQDFAKRHSGKVEKLVLINSCVASSVPMAARALLKVFLLFIQLIPYKGRYGQADYSDYIGTGDLNLRRILNDISFCGTQTYGRVIGLTLDFRTPLDKGFTKPVLILHGTRDMLISSSQARKLKELLPNSKLVMLETDHIYAINAADDVNQAIVRFL